jgi:serine/threonine protein kinase
MFTLTKAVTAKPKPILHRDLKPGNVVLAERDAMDVRGPMMPSLQADGTYHATFAVSDIALRVQKALVAAERKRLETDR